MDATDILDAKLCQDLDSARKPNQPGVAFYILPAAVWAGD